MTTELLRDATTQAYDAIFTQLAQSLVMITVRQRRINDGPRPQGDTYSPVTDTYSQGIGHYDVQALVITESNAINAQNKTEERLNFIVRISDLAGRQAPRPKDTIELRIDGKITRYTLTSVEALPLPTTVVAYDIIGRREI